MLQFLSQVEDDVVCKRTFKAKLLNVGAWFAKDDVVCNKNYLYSIYNNKIVIKFTYNEN